MVWKYLALRIAAGLDFSLLNLAIFLVAFFSGISTQWLAFAEENNSHQTNGEIPFLYSSPFAFRNETPSPAPNVSYGTPHNRPHARTHHVAVPAARGQITDRHGNALAINSAVIYPVFDSYSRVDHPGSRWMNQDHSEMLSWMIEELDYLSEFQAESRESLIRIWLQDYRDFEKDHPYLPYFFSLPFNQEQIEILQQKQAIIPRGFRSIPSYFRLYPSGHAFSHVLGYVDRIRANSAHRKKGMIQLFPRYTGKSFGLDSFFENHLRGTDGSWWRFFNNAKVKLRDEIKKAPQTNHHVVSTLDKELQEAIHSKFIQKNIDGAVYVRELCTGEVWALVSTPSYNANSFRFKKEPSVYNRLHQDPRNPLHNKAFTAYSYPHSLKSFDSIIKSNSESYFKKIPTEIYGLGSGKSIGREKLKLTLIHLAHASINPHLNLPRPTIAKQIVDAQSNRLIDHFPRIFSDCANTTQWHNDSLIKTSSLSQSPKKLSEWTFQRSQPESHFGQFLIEKTELVFHVSFRVDDTERFSDAFEILEEELEKMLR